MTNAQGPVPAGCQGYVATYAQVAARPAIHQARSRKLRSLVVLDEIHHAGDGLSWGEAVGEAFGEVHRRLSLTGTPFRTRAGERIPFVRVRDRRRPAAVGRRLHLRLPAGAGRPGGPTGGVRRLQRRVPVAQQRGRGDRRRRCPMPARSRWRRRPGSTALDPAGGWVPHVIAAMDERITHLRSSGMPDAAGLVLASDQDDARDYADVVRRITGKRPVLILSDDAAASKRIERFRGIRRADRGLRADDLRGGGHPAGRVPGLDDVVPHAAVLRPGGRPGGPGPRRARGGHGVPAGRSAAAGPGRRTGAGPQLRDGAAAAGRGRPGRAPDPLPLEPAEPGSRAIEVLDSQAEFAHVLHSGRAVVPRERVRPSRPAPASPAALTVGDDDQDYLGLPGLLSPEQTAALLATRDSDLRRRVRPHADGTALADRPAGHGRRGRRLAGGRRRCAGR